MEIEFIVDSIYKMPETSKNKLLEGVELVKYKKGQVILSSNRVENSIYFIKKGVARAFSQGNDHEITFWFGFEGDMVISMNSYVNHEKSYEDVELLEDSELYKLDHKHVSQLFFEDLHLANWGRILAEKELIKTEERLISRQFKSAKERYLELLTHEPQLIRRVALGHIASYLGITAVSLSRIRAEI